MSKMRANVRVNVRVWVRVRSRHRRNFEFEMKLACQRHTLAISPHYFFHSFFGFIKKYLIMPWLSILSHTLFLSLSLFRTHSHYLSEPLILSLTATYFVFFVLPSPFISLSSPSVSVSLSFFIFLSHSISFYLSFSLPLYRSLPIIHLHSPSVFFLYFF